MRIYVAGSYAERDVVSQYIARLRAAGAGITLDWPQVVASVGKPDSELTYDERQKYATMDLDAVARADVMWLLIPTTHSKGSWVELGYATALMRLVAGRPRIVTSGSDTACLFTSVYGIWHYPDHEFAFGVLAAQIEVEARVEIP
jgi:hypothetical protein